MTSNSNQLLLDPALTNSEYGSCLILGKSGSGKSTALKKILTEIFQKSKNRKQLYTVNVRDHFYQGIQNVNSVQQIELSDLDEVPRNAVIVVEDVISITRAQDRALRTTLNYRAHHKRQLVFVISHHVFRTSIHSMLPYFNSILFTSAKSNLPLLKHVMQHFKTDQDAQDHVIRHFKITMPAGNAYNIFYFFSAVDQSIYLVNGIENLLAARNLERVDPDPELSEYSSSSVREAKPRLSGGSGSSSKSQVVSLLSSSSPSEKSQQLAHRRSVDILQDKFDKFVSGEKNRHQASAVFSIILGCVPLHLIKETDLTLSFRYKNGRERRGSVSLIDYVTTLLDKNGLCNKNIIFLHRYILKKCRIPKVFMLNSKLCNMTVR